ncbi:MAG: alpha-E domain-containing protein [Candidatus Sericytochromatia bacterium]|nr:alpha-E domain-containing protein [Candidatus Tanganyikabacteria bacterium]
MLSRVAETFYQVGQNLERAEYTARVADVNYQLMLEDPGTLEEEHWRPVIENTGEIARYLERRSALTTRSALEFLCLDVSNPTSVVGAVTAAREAARTIQDQISSELWHHVNRFYLEVQPVGIAQLESEPHVWLSRARDTCYLLAGVIHHTMLHTEGLQFFRVGKFLERALQTEKLLTLLGIRSGTEEGELATYYRCLATLKSASGYEAFRKAMGHAVEPERVAEFLLLERDFPRSVRFCLEEVAISLALVARGDRDAAVELARRDIPLPDRLVGRLKAELEFTDMSEILSHGLPYVLRDLLNRTRSVGHAVARTYFNAPTEVAPGGMILIPRSRGEVRTVTRALRIRQRMLSRYSAPVKDVVTLLRVTPWERHGLQKVVDEEWSIDPPGKIRSYRDPLGNHVWAVEHPRVEEQIAYEVEMLVENTSLLDEDGRPLPPPLDPPGDAEKALYLELTSLVDADERITGVARQLRQKHPDLEQLVAAIADWVTDRMHKGPGKTQWDTPATRALAGGYGVCQDYAQIMLALCRSAGIPARYVSGYVPAEGQMHAWVQVLLPDPETGRERWIAFDPLHAARPTETYVTVAYGRDFNDITPISGRFNHVRDLARHSLDVRVTAEVLVGFDPNRLATAAAAGAQAQQQ